MSRRGALSLAFLIGVHAVVLVPGFFAPYHFATQDREIPLAPPARLHLVDAQGRFHLRPFVYRWVETAPGSAEYAEDRSVAYPLRLFAPGEAYRVLGLFTARRHLALVDTPARLNLLGTDGFGRDQLSRLLYGGAPSLLSGLGAALLATALGLALGALAGFYGGWIDRGLVWTADLFLALPWLYLLLAVRAALPLHVPQAHVIALLVLLVGLVDWPRPARLVRAVVLSAREREYVLAARGFGASDLYLLRRHLLPAASSVVLTQAALAVPRYVMAEVTLSFLGLGVGEPAPSWGNMLAALQRYPVLTSHWGMLAPAAALVPVFLAYHRLAEALQARFGPVPG
jgi:peptide/nickel transport system permease protein